MCGHTPEHTLSTHWVWCKERHCSRWQKFRFEGAYFFPLESLKSHSSQVLCFNFISVQRCLFCITVLVKDITLRRNPIFFSRSSSRRSPPSIHPKCCQTVIWIRKQWFWQGILSRNKSKPGHWRQAVREEHQKRKQWGHSVVTTNSEVCCHVLFSINIGLGLM